MPNLVRVWDQLARRLMAIQPAAEGSVLGFALRRYPGRGVTTADGSRLRRGDLVLELHLDSRLLAAGAGEATTHQRILRLRKAMLSGLRALAARVEQEPRLAEARGVWGLTILHRGVEFLGFTVSDLPPGIGRWLTTWYMRRLLIAYHPEGGDRLHHREEALVAKEIFLPREALLSLYGSGGRTRRERPKRGVGE